MDEYEPFPYEVRTDYIDFKRHNKPSKRAATSKLRKSSSDSYRRRKETPEEETDETIKYEDPAGKGADVSVDETPSDYHSDFSAHSRKPEDYKSDFARNDKAPEEYKSDFTGHEHRDLSEYDTEYVDAHGKGAASRAMRHSWSDYGGEHVDYNPDGGQKHQPPPRRSRDWSAYDTEYADHDSRGGGAKKRVDPAMSDYDTEYAVFEHRKHDVGGSGYASDHAAHSKRPAEKKHTRGGMSDYDTEYAVFEKREKPNDADGQEDFSEYNVVPDQGQHATPAAERKRDLSAYDTEYAEFEPGQRSNHKARPSKKGDLSAYDTEYAVFEPGSRSHKPEKRSKKRDLSAYDTEYADFTPGQSGSRDKNRDLSAYDTEYAVFSKNGKKSTTNKQSKKKPSKKPSRKESSDYRREAGQGQQRDQQRAGSEGYDTEYAVFHRDKFFSSYNAEYADYHADRVHGYSEYGAEFADYDEHGHAAGPEDLSAYDTEYVVASQRSTKSRSKKQSTSKKANKSNKSKKSNKSNKSKKSNKSNKSKKSKKGADSPREDYVFQDDKHAQRQQFSDYGQEYAAHLRPRGPTDYEKFSKLFWEIREVEENRRSKADVHWFD